MLWSLTKRAGHKRNIGELGGEEDNGATTDDEEGEREREEEDGGGANDNAEGVGGSTEGGRAEFKRILAREDRLGGSDPGKLEPVAHREEEQRGRISGVICKTNEGPGVGDRPVSDCRTQDTLSVEGDTDGQSKGKNLSNFLEKNSKWGD